MKVMDLRCRSGQGGHAFEGWFASEDAFREQLARGLVSCPVCGDTDVAKLPSAPRLNLASARERAPGGPGPGPGGLTDADGKPQAAVDLARREAAWWQAAREAVRNTEDVGPGFAREARRIHHGEAEERAIRGQASADEVRQLLEEGVAILPLPGALTETLQ